MNHRSIGLALCLASLWPPPILAAGCDPLFDGVSLDGWTALGEAPFHVENGAIVGTPVRTESNSFLRTDEVFDDFDLRLAFRFDAGMFNSGVQFRSDVYATTTPVRVRARDGEIHEWTMEAGRVYGYQADIDPSDRAWTGEIYDESARGWLRTFDKQPVRRSVKPDSWHRLRIRAEGSHIQTWLDDHPVAELRDDERSEGFVALQVHGIYEAEQAGKRILFKDLVLCRP